MLKKTLCLIVCAFLCCLLCGVTGAGSKAANHKKASTKQFASEYNSRSNSFPLRNKRNNKLSDRELRVHNVAKKNEITYHMKNPNSDLPLPDFKSHAEQMVQEAADQYSEFLFELQADDDDDDDDGYSPYPYSTCFQPTHSTYSFSDFDYNITSGKFTITTYNVNPLFCLNYTQPVALPPPCIKNESELIYVNGLFSSDQTFYTCMANVGDPASAPNFYNGMYPYTYHT
ncbi:hypothetical protein EON63_02860 [archaeon]|nr:MAG: hypothetical protein EON63_02860 [archaeon]